MTIMTFDIIINYRLYKNPSFFCYKKIFKYTNLLQSPISNNIE